MKIQGGKLVVKDGRAACDCCGDDPTVRPPWVPPPDDPIWEGGPSGPVPPSSGSPRCCSGNTICSPVNAEPLLLRYLVTGSIQTQYQYNSGPNAGTPFDYSAEWLEIFDDQSTGCAVSDASDVEVMVPYVSQNGNPSSPAMLPITIDVNRVTWNRNRGFYGDNADDPLSSFRNSGIRYSVDDIRGHVSAGHTLVYEFARSELPSLPITPAVDKADWVRQPFTTIETREPGTTGPSGICLNQIIADYTDSYEDITPGGSTSITITIRLYAFVSGLTPCLTV